MTPVAFLDANALYSATTRSVLMYLAIRGVYRARWSAAVQDEWMAALLKARPDLNPVRLARTRQLMDARILDAVVSDYEHLIASITLPDPKDRHVLAAAIHGGASVIVTANVKDFPVEALAPYRIVTQEPDDFVHSLLLANPESAVIAFAADRARLSNPAMSPAEYIASLRRAGLTETAAALEAFADML